MTVQQLTVSYTEGWNRYSTEFAGMRVHRTSDGMWTVNGMVRCDPNAVNTNKLNSNVASIIAYLPDGTTPLPQTAQGPQWVGSAVLDSGTGVLIAGLVYFDTEGSIYLQVRGCPANFAPRWVAVDLTFYGG